MMNKKLDFDPLSYNDISEYYDQYIKHLNQVAQNLDLTKLEIFYEVLKEVIAKDGIIYTAGNGGSASISNHLNVDFLKGISSNTNIFPRVVPLASETSIITALGNDIDFGKIFSFQISGRIKSNDLLFVISSSGNSKNIIEALNVAKNAKAKTLLVCGFNGGEALRIADASIHFKSQNYGVVEDLSQVIIHILSQFIRIKNLDNSDIKELKL